ncbi:unnamed protein product [Rotaria sordida]|uniref:Uncharacterized protein n=1 Tax=Rotaria sordida TaxID=392033 RepID=A0A819Z5R5_9BILA|nr:unnamed protein product [Rotaria sordida]
MFFLNQSSSYQQQQQRLIINNLISLSIDNQYLLSLYLINIYIYDYKSDNKSLVEEKQKENVLGVEDSLNDFSFVKWRREYNGKRLWPHDQLPQRDLVNYPPYRLHQSPNSVRCKEYIVLSDDFTEYIILAAAVITLVKKLGPTVENVFRGWHQEEVDIYNSVVNYSKAMTG